MKRWYVVKTYVQATSAAAAIRQARKLPPDEAVLDGEQDDEGAASAIGFQVDPQFDDEDDY